MKTNKITLIAGLCVSIAALFFAVLKFSTSIGLLADTPSNVPNDTDSSSAVVDTDADTDSEVIPNVVTLRAVGDNLIDESIFTLASKNSTDGGYNFDSIYENVKEVISKADIAMINQESIISTTQEPSGFPNYCAPSELGDKVAELGFDVVAHALDIGAEGVLDSIEYWDEQKITRIGAYKDQDDMNTVRIQQVNGIKFGYVSITSHLGGFSVDPNSSPVKVMSLTDPHHTTDEVYGTIKTLIESAKEVSDVVIVSMHWRQENVTVVPAGQVDFAKYLVECGADVIIGSGAQVLQPIDWLDKTDGSKALCIYSLGNFVSGGTKANNLLSAIADITFEKNATGGVDISGVGMIPIITHYTDDMEDTKVYLFEDYTEDLANEHGASDMSYSYAKDFFNEMIGTDYLRNYK